MPETITRAAPVAARPGQERIPICGVAIDNVTMLEAVQRVEELILLDEPAYVVTPNVDVIVTLEKDREFRTVYNQASLIVADGMPLIWAGRYLGTPLKGRVPGSDLFIELCRLCAQRGYKVFFLGAQEGVAAEAARKLERRFPGLQVAGSYSPPFGFEKDAAESSRICTMLHELAPDIVFVGVGSLKQEKWITKYFRDYRVPVSMAVGASFDFAAGNIRRAPVWMQRAGLEWFWRLAQEPGRLWRRYLVQDPQFFGMVWQQKRARQA